MDGHAESIGKMSSSGVKPIAIVTLRRLEDRLKAPRVKKRSVKTNVLCPRVSILAAFAKRLVRSCMDFSRRENDEPNPILLGWPTKHGKKTSTK